MAINDYETINGSLSVGQGPQGPQGPKGDIGIGQTGPKGDRGDKGDKGDTGESTKIWLEAGNPTYNNEKVGDMHINWEGWGVSLRTEDEWESLGSIKGDPGSTIFTTPGTPTPLMGTNSDIFINTLNGDLYNKYDDEWTITGNIRGPQGDSTQELVDSRIDSEGKVYTLAGDLIRDIDKKTKSVYSDTYEDEFYITDNAGNVIFKADKNGVEGVNLGSSSSSSMYKGMKLITVGDSLSAHDGWQKWLVEWLGFNFNLSETINGSNGFSPTAKGGTAVRPKETDSIYMRSLDVKNYVDNVNGTVIILNAVQNDWFPASGVGTINDTPYRARQVDANSDNGTLYSYYMGMVENLLADNPKTQIFLVTAMQMWTADNKQDESRNTKRKMVIDIAEKYGLPVIDLWTKSGVNSFNGSEHYPEIGNVHPTDYGYKKMAYCICRELGGK